MMEYVTVVVYDLTNNRFRTKVSDRCLDYGLKRFQYSGFVGKLTEYRRRNLYQEIVKLIQKSKEPGRVMMIPLPRSSFEKILAFEDTDQKEGD